MHPRRPTEIFGLFAATTVLPGVGPKLAAAIEKRIGAHVIDLLRHLPIGLIDRRADALLDCRCQFGSYAGKYGGGGKQAKNFGRASGVHALCGPGR